MLTLLIVLVLLATAFWAVARFYLSGPDLAAFDMPRYDPVRTDVSPGHAAVVALLGQLMPPGARQRGRAGLLRMRETIDSMADAANLEGVAIQPVNAGGVAGEWVTADGSDGRGRLLYIHGGAFAIGSPRSHRGITAELARRTRLAVLAIDYRLMPEHPRLAGIEDCRTAYRWLVRNGPRGAGAASRLFVAGDSAGGNLALMLIAWLRDQRRTGSDLPQVDGAIALSPTTDSTFSSPSITGNIDKDPMLGPLAKLLTRVPRPLFLWMGWLQSRVRPCDPQLSPVFGDLADLPPTLVQASEAEILIDDARRWVNKARAAGSPAELETWHGMVHVWQAFGRLLPEAGEAFARIAAFVTRIDAGTTTRAGVTGTDDGAAARAGRAA